MPWMPAIEHHLLKQLKKCAFGTHIWTTISCTLPLLIDKFFNQFLFLFAHNTVISWRLNRNNSYHPVSHKPAVLLWCCSVQLSLRVCVCIVMTRLPAVTGLFRSIEVWLEGINSNADCKASKHVNTVPCIGLCTRQLLMQGCPDDWAVVFYCGSRAVSYLNAYINI